jgi:hypothetical protein
MNTSVRVIGGKLRGLYDEAEYPMPNEMQRLLRTIENRPPGVVPWFPPFDERE